MSHEFDIEVIYTVIMYGTILFLGTRPAANRLLDRITQMVS